MFSMLKKSYNNIGKKNLKQFLYEVSDYKMQYEKYLEVQLKYHKSNMNTI